MSIANCAFLHPTPNQICFTNRSILALKINFLSFTLLKTQASVPNSPFISYIRCRREGTQKTSKTREATIIRYFSNRFFLSGVVLYKTKIEPTIKIIRDILAATRKSIRIRIKQEIAQPHFKNLFRFLKSYNIHKIETDANSPK